MLDTLPTSTSWKLPPPECFLFAFPLTNLLHIATLYNFFFVLSFLSSEIFLSTAIFKSKSFIFFISFHLTDTSTTHLSRSSLCMRQYKLQLDSISLQLDLVLSAIFDKLKNKTSRVNFGIYWSNEHKYSNETSNLNILFAHCNITEMGTKIDIQKLTVSSEYRLASSRSSEPSVKEVMQITIHTYTRSVGFLNL